MFKGADVDGLDRMTQKVNQAAEFAQTVLMVLQATIAALRAMSWTGWAAAFAAYLEAVVVPWVKVTVKALQAFAAVLAFASSQQKEVSGDGPQVSIPPPVYRTPELPTGDTSRPPMLDRPTGPVVVVCPPNASGVAVGRPTLPGEVTVRPGVTGAGGGGSTVSTPEPSGPATGISTGGPGAGTPVVDGGPGTVGNPTSGSGPAPTAGRGADAPAGPGGGSLGGGTTGSLSGSISRGGHTGTFEVSRAADGSWTYDVGANGTFNRPDAGTPVLGGPSTPGTGSGTGGGTGGSTPGALPGAGGIDGGLGGGTGSGALPGGSGGSGAGPGGAGDPATPGPPGGSTVTPTPITPGGGLDGGVTGPDGLPVIDTDGADGNGMLAAAPLGLAGLAGLGAAAMGRGLLGGQDGASDTDAATDTGTEPGTGAGGAGSTPPAPVDPDSAWAMDVGSDGDGGQRIELTYGGTDALGAGTDPLCPVGSVLDGGLGTGTDTGRVDAWIESDGSYRIVADGIRYDGPHGEVVIDGLDLSGDLDDDDPETAAAVRAWFAEVVGGVSADTSGSGTATKVWPTAA